MAGDHVDMRLCSVSELSTQRPERASIRNDDNQLWALIRQFG